MSLKKQEPSPEQKALREDKCKKGLTGGQRQEQVPKEGLRGLKGKTNGGREGLWTVAG